MLEAVLLRYGWVQQDLSWLDEAIPSSTSPQLHAMLWMSQDVAMHSMEVYSGLSHVGTLWNVRARGAVLQLLPWQSQRVRAAVRTENRAVGLHSGQMSRRDPTRAPRRICGHNQAKMDGNKSRRSEVQDGRRGTHH